MQYLVAPLRAVADSAGVLSIKQLVSQPGVKAVYRLIARYADRQHCDSVATLVYSGQDVRRLEVVYSGMFDHRPLVYTIARADYEAFTTVLLRAHFDKLNDQDGLSVYGEDVWLLERAASTFHKSVIFAPHRPALPYSLLVNALDTYLPEAIREVEIRQHI